ncbi:hypothetical protein, partial [Escherichia coli]
AFWATPENLPTIYRKPRVMYMEHPFAASEISGSCSHVAQSTRPSAALFLILRLSVDSPANGAFLE